MYLRSMSKIFITLLCLYSTIAYGQQYDFSAVDKYIEDHAGVYDNGVAVLVTQNGKVIYKKESGLGVDDKRLVASCSKWLSGAVIMSLVDEGKLSLTDTIGKFLPIFSQYHKGNITIRQLFSHTSGFPGNSPGRYESSAFMTLESAVDSIAVYTDMINPPGTKFNYGGVSMQVAGRIAEMVSGKSWQALFNEKIGKPCDMNANYIIMSFRNPMIAGGVRTSATDYIHFLEMIVNKGVYKNKRVLSEAAIATMLQDQTNGAAIENTPYPRNPFSPQPDKPVRYGIGNWIDVVSPDGKILETSSPGAFGTHPWQDEVHHVAGIIFTRTELKKSALVSLEIRKMIRDILDKKP
ncbi:class A beta-lactamase-related serine hydrolase [Chitinophaga silvisoli]|uniref:Class A beta-lactamase-related serine hydrolase n=2 Tax=Chitinophaga silvisoli TaxID=2291814 RepID=A0A3E1P9M3_9BACT|nr:class A beta-lactamase-related serine hydrolase [Chitinophaga silvisoli]